MPWEPLHEGSADPRPMRDGLDAVMNRLGGTTVSAVEAVMNAWEDIVGEALGHATSPVKIEDGCLTVRTDEAILSAEIKWLEPTIIERVAAIAGGTRLQRVNVVVRAARTRPDRR